MVEKGTFRYLSDGDTFLLVALNLPDCGLPLLNSLLNPHFGLGSPVIPLLKILFCGGVPLRNRESIPSIKLFRLESLRMDAFSEE